MIVKLATGVVPTTPNATNSEATDPPVSYKSVSKRELFQVLARIKRAYPRLGEEVERAENAMDLPQITDAGAIDDQCHLYTKSKWGVTIRVGTCCLENQPCKLAMIAACLGEYCVGLP